MQHSSPKFLSFAIFFSFALFIVGGCSMALGPGYTIQKQNLELRYIPSPEPHLAVRATYQLVNSGNQPLEAIQITLSSSEAFHRQGTIAHWNNQSISFQKISPANLSEQGDTIELRWPEAWRPKQRRTLILDYELSSGSHLGSFLAVSRDTFFAYPGSWNPVLLPPKNIFAAGGVPPKKWTIAVRVPAGDLAHASGTAGRRTSSRGEWLYSFTQLPHGFAPFAAGGNYVESRIDSGGRDVLFWMRKPVDAAVAQTAATSISTRAHYYETEYGTPANRALSIRLLECVIPVQNFGCGALPGTILVQQAWVDRGLAGRKFYEDVNFELAYTWFGGIAHVAFDQSPLPMDALAPYAGWEAQAVEDGGEARAERIRNLIAEFDRSAATCKEKVILPRPANLDDCSYSAAWAKSGLFFFALEDKVGRAPFHAALKSMLADRRGREIGLEDLVASLDAEAHETQGAFIRQWLKHPAIPEEFRTRYRMAVAPAANSGTNSSKETHP